MRAQLRSIEQVAAARSAADAKPELKMPPIQGFYLSSAFRLWIATAELGCSSPAL